LIDFIRSEDERLRNHYKLDKDKTILARTVKLMEELGELCNDVLAHSSLQRKEKLDTLDKENLSKEFADVIIVLLLLAHVMGVDIFEGLGNAIKKVKARSYG
jgi:NTP pyrophosphatase (non-canonical NTP hydrolase)